MHHQVQEEDMVLSVQVLQDPHFQAALAAVVADENQQSRDTVRYFLFRCGLW